MIRLRPGLALLLAAGIGCGEPLEQKDPGDGHDPGPPVQVATPVITVSGERVTITTATPYASVYFTLDGTTPTNRSSIYDGPFFVTLAPGLLQIRAVATRSGLLDSYVGGKVVATAAQVVESFGADPHWTVTQEGSGNVWTWNASLGAYRIVYSSPTLREDSKLVSPRYHLPASYGHWVLGYREGWHGGYPGYWSQGEVMVSVDDGATWERVALVHADTGQGTYNLDRDVTLDVSAWSGQTVRFAFRYLGNYDWDWTVDDFLLFGE